MMSISNTMKGLVLSPSKHLLNKGAFVVLLFFAGLLTGTRSLEEILKTLLVVVL